MEPVNNKSAFKLRSGNKPSPMELSGVSPVKHVDATTGEQLKTDTSTNPEMSSINQATGDMSNFSTGSLGNYPGIKSRMAQAGLRKA